jgi:hypothetical protein
MGWVMITAGVGVLGFTAYERRRGETDASFLSDWLDFDIDRDENPLLFHGALIAQIVAGIGLIVGGVKYL